MNPYLEQKILMADPVELVQMIIHTAISDVQDARACLRERKIAQRTRAINRAYAVVNELNVALDIEAAPELATRLRELYLYIQQRLVEANAEKSDSALCEILALLETLSEGWNGVVEAQRVNGKRAPSHPHSIPEMAGERLALIA